MALKKNNDVSKDDETNNVKAEQDDDDYEAWEDEGEVLEAGNKPKKKYKAQRKSAAGRKLMRWSPDVDQLVLLTIEQVCNTQHITLPWNEIAAQVEPFLTGEGLKQHLVKVYNARVEAGRKVPKKIYKNPNKKKIASMGQLTGFGTPKNSPVGGTLANNPVHLDDDNGKTITPRSAALLYHVGQPVKNNISPKKQYGKDKKDAVPTTPSNSGGKSNIPSKSRSKTTGKRNRKSKQVTDSSDEEALAGSQSPTKKQKTISLRPTAAVNYNEQPSEDELLDPMHEDQGDDDVFDGSPEKKSIKKEPTSSQKSNTSASLPSPPHFPYLDQMPRTILPMTSAMYTGGNLDPEAAYTGSSRATALAGSVYQTPREHLASVTEGTASDEATPIAPVNNTDEDTIQVASKKSSIKRAVKIKSEYREPQVHDESSSGGQVTMSDSSDTGTSNFTDDSRTGIIPIANDTGRGQYQGGTFGSLSYEDTAPAPGTMNPNAMHVGQYPQYPAMSYDAMHNRPYTQDTFAWQHQDEHNHAHSTHYQVPAYDNEHGGPHITGYYGEYNTGNAGVHGMYGYGNDYGNMYGGYSLRGGASTMNTTVTPQMSHLGFPDTHQQRTFFPVMSGNGLRTNDFIPRNNGIKPRPATNPQQLNDIHDFVEATATGNVHMALTAQGYLVRYNGQDYMTNVGVQGDQAMTDNYTYTTGPGHYNLGPGHYTRDMVERAHTYDLTHGMVGLGTNHRESHTSNHAAKVNNAVRGTAGVGAGNHASYNGNHRVDTSGRTGPVTTAAADIVTHAHNADTEIYQYVNEEVWDPVAYSEDCREHYGHDDEHDSSEDD